MRHTDKDSITYNLRDDATGLYGFALEDDHITPPPLKTKRDIRTIVRRIRAENWSKFWADTVQDWRYAWEYRGYENVNPERQFAKHDEFQLAVICTCQFLRHLAERLVCVVLDHQLVDYSTIGPDSGTESVQCNRCGWGWSHTYY